MVGSKSWKLSIAAGVLAGGLMTQSTPLQAAASPGVLPPQSTPYGMSYGEWAGAWWQWAFSLPVTGHPLFDQTGADAAVGQSGPVWFLGGTFILISSEDESRVIGVATRNITVPVGKALFFPILNTEANNWSMPPDPPTTLTEAELRDIATWITDHATDMTCTIDGRPVKGLGDVLTCPYRVQSPLFYYTLPAQDNLWQHWGLDVTGQNPAPGSITDGVYLMVAPLSVGRHTIHFTGTEDIPDWQSFFSLDITYNITVVNPGKAVGRAQQ